MNKFASETSKTILLFAQLLLQST